MKVIGLTGGIASGKSTVSRILREEFGIPIVVEYIFGLLRDIILVGYHRRIGSGRLRLRGVAY